MKAKWKGLRDNFRVEFKKVPRNEITGELLQPADDFESKWAHYKSLTFLVEHMRARGPKQYFYSNDVPSFETILEQHRNATAAVAAAQAAAAVAVQSTAAASNDSDPPTVTAEATLNVDGVTVNLGTLSAPTTYHGGHHGVNGIKRCRSEADEDSSDPENPLKNLDDDYHFLLSLHPYLTQLNASQKLKVRMKIQKLIFKELYKEEDIDDGK